MATEFVWLVWVLFIAILGVLWFRSNRLRRTQYIPAYVSIKESDLQSASDEEIEEMILDHVYWRIGDQYHNTKAILKSLPLPVQFVYATWWVEAEVYNGGFNQYFINSAGDLVDMALQGYAAMGLNDHRQLLLKAAEINQSIIEKEGKTTRSYKNLEEVAASYDDNELNQLDQAFYLLEDKEMAGAKRIKYIRSRADQFENAISQE